MKYKIGFRSNFSLVLPHLRNQSEGLEGGGTARSEKNLMNLAGVVRRKPF